MKKIICVILLATGIINAQINPTSNFIGVDINMPQNSAFNYDSCFKIGADLGMKQIGLFQEWKTVETNSVTFNTSNLDIANIYYPAYNMSVDLTLAPIATNVLEVPPDLTATAFSSTIMINRFKRFLDTVKAHIPNVTLSSLVIGSEHDIYLASNATKWAEYTTFYNAVSIYAKTLWPGLKVATELTFDGLVNQNSFAQTLNANSDYIGISYYPLNSNFTVKPVSVIPTDFATVVGLYPSKPICYYQFGYPSSTVCASSNNQQKQFITQAFTSWDVYQSNIRMIDFTWLHDLSTAQVNYYATYYGLTNPVFLEYLRTLGFRDWNNNGTDKPALNELRCQAKQRGYNNLPHNCIITGIKENKNTGNLNVFPNPSSGILNIQLPVNVIGKILISDVFGKLIKEIELVEQIDLSNLSDGIYFLNVYNSEQQINYNSKIIINK